MVAAVAALAAVAAAPLGARAAGSSPAPGAAPAPAAAPAPPAAPASGVCGADWPMYQHDASRSAAACGSAVEAGTVATLTPSWVARTANPVTATPTVSGTQVFVGDAGGVFYALDRASGAPEWTFDVRSNACHGDRHAVSYGEITSTAAVSTQPDGQKVVLFGGGGTLYALDAATGACAWYRDLDPQNPASAMEIESSPVVMALPGRDTRVLVGSDSNESPGSSAPPGVQAFEAANGSLLWKYEPEVGQTGTVVQSLSAPSDTDGCGDVWSSPAVDPAGAGGHGLVVFGTGNCPARSTLESIVALDARTGLPQWRFEEPQNDYSSTQFGDGGDTDIGSSPIVTTIGTTPAVIEASKSGYVYAVDEENGKALWSVQAAQPGELGGSSGIGGFIGSAALGPASLAGVAAPSSTWFGASAIPAAFDGDGTTPDTSLACIDAGRGYAATVGTAACDPLRAASLHAVDAATGHVLWQAAVSLPTYSAVTYANGVVFAPSTTGFSVVAYDAGTGTPLWSFPLGATVASGAAVAGAGVYLGSGISEGGTDVPGVNGVWAFGLAGR